MTHQSRGDLPIVDELGDALYRRNKQREHQARRRRIGLTAIGGACLLALIVGFTQSTSSDEDDRFVQLVSGQSSSGDWRLIAYPMPDTPCLSLVLGLAGDVPSPDGCDTPSEGASPIALEAANRGRSGFVFGTVLPGSERVAVRLADGRSKSVGTQDAERLPAVQGDASDRRVFVAVFSEPVSDVIGATVIDRENERQIFRVEGRDNEIAVPVGP